MVTRSLSISLVALLFGLTFNAYACLIPLYSVEQTPMGCESSPDQPARDYCDVFKTFSIEHAIMTFRGLILTARPWGKPFRYR